MLVALENSAKPRVVIIKNFKLSPTQFCFLCQESKSVIPLPSLTMVLSRAFARSFQSSSLTSRLLSAPARHAAQTSCRRLHHQQQQQPLALLRSARVQSLLRRPQFAAAFSTSLARQDSIGTGEIRKKNLENMKRRKWKKG
jgi:hypothetical protein